MLARMPPTIRWPLSPFKPAAAAAARNSESRAGLLNAKVTFIQDRESAAIEFWYRREASMQAYSIAAFAWLRLPISATPPAAISHLKTRPAMYQAKVGGVFNMD